MELLLFAIILFLAFIFLGRLTKSSTITTHGLYGLLRVLRLFGSLVIFFIALAAYSVTENYGWPILIGFGWLFFLLFSDRHFDRNFPPQASRL